MFCSNIFRVSYFTVNFYVRWYVSNLFPLIVDIQFSQNHLLKILSFLQSMSLASLSNIKWLYLGYLRLVFFFCFLGLQSIFMPPFYYFSVFITIALEIWTANPISLAIQGLLWFQMKFWFFFFSISLKNEMRILIGSALSLWTVSQNNIEIISCPSHNREDQQNWNGCGKRESLTYCWYYKLVQPLWKPMVRI